MTKTVIAAFKDFLPYEWEPTEAQVDTLSKLCHYAIEKGFSLRNDYTNILIEAVNQKLALNGDIYKHILDTAFFEKIKLNYILKTKIKNYLDSGDTEGYYKLLSDNSIFSEKMRAAFTPVSREQTMNAFSDIYFTDKKYNDVYCSIFSRFCFNLFDKECTFSFFSGKHSNIEDYFDFLENKYPDISNRQNALGIIDISPYLFNASYEEGCNIVLNSIKTAFKKLNNHCELCVYLPSFGSSYDGMQWKLYADIILFAEKFRKEKIDKTYFRWEKIATQTCNYINRIVPFNAEFEYAFQGFVFKDCFVIAQDNNKYDIMIVLEKNVRDERIINCPACRSDNIQGNSYPILNVRSWECENPLCPDRSKYNRGKRYAFMSLFRQKEMQNDENLIPESSISKWRLDCLSNATRKDVFEMIIRHYSCVDDGVFIFSNDDQNIISNLNRKISCYHFERPLLNLLSDFKNGSYFYRFIQTNYAKPSESIEWEYEKAKVFCGDAYDVLRTIEDETFDGAVTSPPYYNAKSYSQWPNIYCYLYDMYNIFSEVYRTMKDGAVLLFNIFDYFDNENNIVLSAMGNKRMILGAYMIDIFERIGFKICGNIIWNKGEIQGSRSFNQGNLTPYYQAPLNCWEHILIVSKGEQNKALKNIESCIKQIRPVIKMVKGKNILGHDAPYPQEIPDLLITHLPPDSIILDPFLGSGTTSIVANKRGIRSIGIEKDLDYFRLCQQKIQESSMHQLKTLY